MPDDDGPLEPEELAALQYTQRVMKGALVDAANAAVASHEPGSDRTRAMMRAVAVEVALAFVSGYREGAMFTLGVLKDNSALGECKLTAGCRFGVGHPGKCGIAL